MQQSLPIVTNQQISDEGLSYLGHGSSFQTTAYDTSLIISDSKSRSVFHHFKLFDRKILWINQVRQELRGETIPMMPRTIFSYNENNFDGHIVAHRFSSVLCYATHANSISPRAWAGVAYPVSSVVQPAEKYVGIIYDHNHIDSKIQQMELNNFTDKQWAALAHYRQSTLAQTPYYKILSYWKIFELYFKNERTGIDSHINELYSSRPDIFHELGSFKGTAANKLRSLRHASAHFMLKGSTTIEDPDNPDVYNKVSEGLLALRRLSENLIDRTNGW